MMMMIQSGPDLPRRTYLNVKAKEPVLMAISFCGLYLDEMFSLFFTLGISFLSISIHFYIYKLLFKFNYFHYNF